jgi:hypothetical protein
MAVKPEENGDGEEDDDEGTLPCPARSSREFFFFFPGIVEREREAAVSAIVVRLGSRGARRLAPRLPR